MKRLISFWEKENVPVQSLWGEKTPLLLGPLPSHDRADGVPHRAHLPLSPPAAAGAVTAESEARSRVWGRRHHPTAGG